MQTQILFEEPGKNKNEYSYYGASPKFIFFLKQFFEKNRSRIKSVKLAIYLFNNIELHKMFLRLAEEGTDITVISIPLEGYDDTSPQSISKSDEEFLFEEKQTKKSLAENVYSHFLMNQVTNYKLLVFPHTYIRSSKIKPFSRGKVPYSLHTKSLFVEMMDGRHLIGISSSNLAIRDLPKHDSFVFTDIPNEEIKSVNTFFDQLIYYSIPVEKCHKGEGLLNIPIEPLVFSQNKCNNFMAPFFSNSPEMMEQKIIAQMLKARHRIWIMGQHISAYNYKVPLQFRIKHSTNAVIKRKGFLAVLLRKGLEGLDIRCFSQTFVDDCEVTGNFRKPANTYNFKKFINEYKKLPNAKYAVSDSIHSKYIIVDDLVMVTTFNFTPTQFISLPYVNITHFENIPDFTYKGIFSEVGHMMILNNKREAGSFVKNFEYAWKSNQTQILI